MRITIGRTGASSGHSHGSTPSNSSHLRRCRGRLRGTLVHLLWSEINWLARWAGRPTLPRFAEDDFPAVADLRAGWSASKEALRAFLAILDDAQLHYTRTNGEPRSRIFWQLLVHIVNHGTQHHTEAAILLTQYGASPGDIDLHLSPLGQTDQ